MKSSHDSDCSNELQGAPTYLAQSCPGINVPASPVRSITRYPERAVRRATARRLSTAETKPATWRGEDCWVVSKRLV